jgi:hypothetical protein
LRPFANISNNLRIQLYARALKIREDDTIGTGYSACGLEAAKEAFVSIPTTDRPILKQQIYRRAIVMGQLLKVANAAASISPDHSVDPSVEKCNINGDGNSLSFVERPRGAGRKGKLSRKQKVPGEFTKHQDQHHYKGAKDHATYRSAFKQVMTVVAQYATTSKLSIRESGGRM